MTLQINLGNFNVILFLVLVVAALTTAVVLSTPSLLHSVALYCLVRRDTLLSHRRMVARLKEHWRSEVPYPNGAECSPESKIDTEAVAAAGR